MGGAGSATNGCTAAGGRSALGSAASPKRNVCVRIGIGSSAAGSCKALPFVSIAGILVCGSMIYGLGWTNWLRLIGWLAVGLIIYGVYGRKHSRLAVR